MPTVYYPGCQYTGLSPENSGKIQDYLRKRRGMEVTGCCRKHHEMLGPGDTAVCVCPTCLNNLQATAPHADIQSLWEVAADDGEFPWPDYGGQAMTVQDCMDTRNNLPLKEAVRRMLHRMNVQIVELAAPADEMDFCRPRTDEQAAAVKRHSEGYATDTVVCYCTGCWKALRGAGVHGVHLLDLMMGDC